MKLALVYPQFNHKQFNENLKVVDEAFGVFPHINFGYVSREAKEVGWTVQLFDGAARRISNKELLDEIQAFKPDLIGCAAHAAQTFHDLLAFMKELREQMATPVLVGGYEAKLYPNEIMRHSCFDFLCATDASQFVKPFLRVFEKNGDFKTIPGLYFRERGTLTSTPCPPPLAFRSHPIPDRSIFDHSLYFSHVSQRRNFTIALSSIGCPYQCNFCCMGATGFDARTAESIFSEMKLCREEYGIREIDFFDPVMLHNKERILSLCKLIIDSNLDVIWSARARIDSLTSTRSADKADISFIQTLSKAGCRRLFVGIESGDQGILNSIDKSLSLTQVRDVITCLDANGIMSLGFFMIGNPGETHQTIQNTVKLALSIPLKYAQFSVTTIKPHSQNDRILQKQRGNDYWSDYISGTAPETPIPLTWTQLSREELQAAAKKAYISFYFRPKYILGILRDIESFSELLKYIRVAIRMFLQKGPN